MKTRYCFSQSIGQELAKYTRRGRHRPALNLKKGDVLNSFEIQLFKKYQDFDINHIHLKNNNNHLQIHQLQCQQENNTISFIFKTKKSNKPGLNFALDKLLQCGSKSFPVRDLGKQMKLRSFTKIPSSLTSQNYLMFAFNSPIYKDFNNLLDVYSSMIFQPLLRQQDFYEVVRRLTYQKQLGLSGQLASQFNQSLFMLDRTIYSLINQYLMGQNNQAICRPIDLVNLNYNDLKQHYQNTINLQNCTIINHGDISPSQLTNQIKQSIQKYHKKTNNKISMNVQETYSKPIQKKTINFQHLGREQILMISYRIDNATEQQIILLQLLSYLLFDMPESPFMKFITPQTPYPPLYGFHQRYFNIGLVFTLPFDQNEQVDKVASFKKRQKQYLQRQKQVYDLLNQIVTNKLNNKLIQKCLYHIQGSFNSASGINIIQSITSNVLSGRSLDRVFEVSALINKLLKIYRKQNIFQNIINKFIINNSNYVVLRGKNNTDLIQQEHYRNKALLQHIKLSLPDHSLKNIANYTPPNILQDFNKLPVTHPTQLEYFQDLRGQNIKIANIDTIWNYQCFGNKIIFKFDMTDMGDQDIPLLTLFCKAFPKMGSKSIKSQAYSNMLDMYIGNISMNFQTTKVDEDKMKFSDRNIQHATNILNALLNQFNPNNIMAISKTLHQISSEYFNQLSRDIIGFHGLHLASSKSPYLFFSNPLFQARNICSMASDVKKVANPKNFYHALSLKFDQIWQNMMKQKRINVLWECKPQRKNIVHKYLNIILSQIKDEGLLPQTIDVTSFPQNKWQKYFPNYEEQLLFQSFKMPYRQKFSPASLVLATIIDQNINNYNSVGGCFLHKGTLISFIKGNRIKAIQLQQYYKKIDNIDAAKRKIFQNFGRYTIQRQFRSSISYEQARIFKQGVITVEQKDLQHVLEENILSVIKNDKSSLLCLGPRLENYQPLIKKNWQIQRAIDDLSLKAQSLSRQEIRFNFQKYYDIC